MPPQPLSPNGPLTCSPASAADGEATQMSDHSCNRRASQMPRTSTLASWSPRPPQAPTSPLLGASQDGSRLHSHRRCSLLLVVSRELTSLSTDVHPPSHPQRPAHTQSALPAPHHTPTEHLTRARRGSSGCIATVEAPEPSLQPTSLPRTSTTLTRQASTSSTCSRSSRSFRPFWVTNG